MHFPLKFLRAFDLQNPVSPSFDYRVPVHTVKFRIEVLGFDKVGHLVENGFSLAGAEAGHWETETVEAPSPCKVKPAQK